MTEIERLRAELARAEVALRNIEYADNYCYTNGVRDGYVAVIRDIERQISNIEEGQKRG